MEVEIEISDLPDMSYYKDLKCKNLEVIFQKDTKFSEYVVKRLRYADECEFDPFVILDAKGDVLIWLEEWEIDTLNDSELLAYIDVQKKRKSIVNGNETAMGLLFIASIVVFSVISLIFLPTAILGILTPRESGTIIASGLLMVVSGPIFFLQYRTRHTKERNIDLDAAKNGSMFLEALRKLANLPEAVNMNKDYYVKRLKMIEDAITGVSS